MSVPRVWNGAEWVAGSAEVDWDDIGDVPESFVPSAHTHIVDDVTGLEGIIDTHELTSNKGVAGGYVPLDGTVHIPAVFIPGSVDDIIEVDTFADFPQPGVKGKLYVALDTGNTYRWGGTQYAEIAASPGSTDAVPEGVTNLYYTDVRAKAAAASSYETRVAANEAAVVRIDATNTIMSGDVSDNSTDITDLKNNKADTATLNAVQGVLAGLIAEKANSNDPRFDLAVSAVQPAVFNATIQAVKNQLLLTGVPVDVPYPNTVTVESLEGNGQNTTIDGGAYVVLPGDPGIQAIGGEQLVRDNKGTQAAWCFQWRFPAGANVVTPSVNQGSPWPRSWSVQFDVVNADQVEFIVFDYGGYYNLTMNGQLVWPFAQPTNSGGTVSAPAYRNIKVTLPDRGLHRVRFHMGNMSLVGVGVQESGSVLPRPIYSPRAYFLGDGVTQGQNSGDNFSEISSWIYKFSEMIGVYDIWDDAWKGWGAVTGGAANMEARATACLIPASPDIVFLEGYTADLALDPATVAAAWGRTIDIARSAPSQPLVFAIGSFAPIGDRPAAYVSMDAAIRAVCAEKGVCWIEPSTGSLYAPDGTALIVGNEPWITPSGRGQYIDIDFVSLTQIGQLFYAYKVYDFVRTCMKGA